MEQITQYLSDHEPNTCPVIKEVEEGGVEFDDKKIKQFAEKICGLFSFIQTFPAPVKVWVISEASKGLTGMLEYLAQRQLHSFKKRHIS